MGPLHRALGAFAAELLLRKPRDHNGKLMWRQCIRVVQHRGHRQVFAAHRTINHNLQAFDCSKDIDRAPIAASTIVVNDIHQPISSDLRAFCSLAS